MDSQGPFPGDDILPDAKMIYDQHITIHAPPASIFPWLLQIGKARGGWYLPSTWERFLPSTWHASRTINPSWTALKPGDRVADYGFNADEDWFDVVSIDAPNSLVLRSERYGAVFTWVLMVRDVGEGRSVVHLRFRGRIAATGVRRAFLVWGGGWMDWASTRPMLSGLKERVERAKVE